MHHFSPPVGSVDDLDLVARLRAAYRAATDGFQGYGASQWATIDGSKAAFQNILVNGSIEKLAVELRNPATNNLFFGFDSLTQSRSAALRGDESLQAKQGRKIEQAIEMLAAAVGAARINNPEAPDHRPPEKHTSDKLIALVREIVRVDFPNPYPDESGVVLESGTASFRAVLAVYQQFRTLQLMRMVQGKSILEIGAGLGRACYYCYRSGATDYTIIDTPLTNLAQGYFLGRTLGPEKISLFGEGSLPGAVRILPPSSLPQTKADVVVNVDSLTEMERSAADTYVAHAQRTAKVFLSINHEVNQFTAREVIGSQIPGCELMRYPAPLRAGYVEEIAFLPRRSLSWRVKRLFS